MNRPLRKPLEMKGSSARAHQVDRVVPTRADTVRCIRSHGLGQPDLPDTPGSRSPCTFASWMSRLSMNPEGKPKSEIPISKQSPRTQIQMTPTSGRAGLWSLQRLGSLNLFRISSFGIRAFSRLGSGSPCTPIRSASRLSMNRVHPGRDRFHPVKAHKCARMRRSRTRRPT